MIDNQESRDLPDSYQFEAETVANRIVGGCLGGYKNYYIDGAIGADLRLSAT